MPHRAYLFSLRIGHALRQACIEETYTGRRFGKDLLAGITVGIIAIPLSMALAIATGVPPQYGLYTAIVAGFVIALTGGSRLSISGPTAAFIVILYPIVQQFGLGGLLIASVMAGALLILMAVLRLGRLIKYIPESVTLGFTAGIAVVIATLQLKDALGLAISDMPEHYAGKVWALAQAIPDAQLGAVMIAALTLAVMILWPRLKTPVPAHLPAVLASTGLALVLISNGMEVDTIASRFSYVNAEGLTIPGIPQVLPELVWPWAMPDANGQPLELSLSLIQSLLPAAFAIAMLGAIESLLCAVVLDGMTGRRHSANSELLGQGIGNLVTPFFGGITATAAIARSAANYRAGAESPVSAMIHALTVLLALLLLAPVLGYLPMAAMAGLLLMVAWNMSEVHKAIKLLKTAPRSDILVFLTCFGLTVMMDMVIAIVTGVLLAAVLFVKEMAEMTRVTEITSGGRVQEQALPEHWRVFKITGPLFFAAADRVFGELAAEVEVRSRAGCGLILYLDGVTLLDAGGLSTMSRFIDLCGRRQCQVVIADLQFQPLRTLARAGVKPIPGVSVYAPSLEQALQLARQGEGPAI